MPHISASLFSLAADHQDVAIERVEMTSTSEQIRSYSGPAILSFGFRPFFLLGALWAAVAIALWLPMLSGHLNIPSAFTPIEWHVHELIYGYVPAVIAGFLLTAVPNWTGRLPVVGAPLLILVSIWLAGRIAILVSAMIGSGIAAVIDLLFLTVLAMVIGREIIAGKNARNAKVLAVIGLLIIGNAVFHLEAILAIGNGHGKRIGIAATVLLIIIIGGRIIPSFTRNWLVRQNAGRLPIPFNRFDVGVIIVSSLALGAWIVAPEHAATALLCLVAGIANAARLTRWAGERTSGEPLVAILHLAYAFVPMGFVVLTIGDWWPDIVLAAGGIHTWTTGAIALMTLSVMTRASLGHTGRRLTATTGIKFIYIAALIAACTRIAAAFNILREPMLHISAAAWVLAFGGFVAIYAPMLMRRS